MRSSLQASLLLGFLIVATSASAVNTHPIWGPLSQPDGNSSVDPVVTPSPGGTQPSYTPRISSAQILANFKSRVCARVERRFAHDPVMIERINTRLEKRFGFTCSIRGIVQDPAIDFPQQQGSVTVEIDEFGSIGDILPRGATNVPMLRVIFTAPCDGAATIYSFTVSDNGVGLASDISELWLAVDGERIVRHRALNRDKTMTLAFPSPLVIPACRSIAVDVMAAISRTSIVGGIHMFSIDAASDVHADSVVHGSFPISGESFEVGSVQTGSMNMEYKSTNPYVDIEGSFEQVIGKFALSVDHSEEQTIHSMLLENKGSAKDGDFVAIFLRSTYGQASFTQIMGGTIDDRVVLLFDPPFSIRKGERVHFEVVADIVDGNGRTIEMHLEEPIDLLSVGSRTGFGDNGQLYGSRVSIDGNPAKVEIR